MVASSLKLKDLLDFIAEKEADYHLGRSRHVAKRLAEKFGLNEEEVRRAIFDAEREYFEIWMQSRGL